MEHVLTLVADREASGLTRAMIGRVRDALGPCGEAVELSPGEAADIPFGSAPDLAGARQALHGEAVDVLATTTSSRRRRLLVADMDSTIVTGETLDELAEFAGVGEEVAAITRRSMNGDVDFREALLERAALLAGLGIEALEATWQAVRLTDGARTLVSTMRANGARTALVSGGFSFFASRVAEWCGFDEHQSNRLLDDGARLTGTIGEPVLDREAKLAALKRLAASMGLGREDTLAVGDGANDLAMLREAGLAVAFHAKPVVAAQVANRVDHGNLRALLFAQGYRADEFASD